MRKIASPRAFQAELHGLLAYCRESKYPSRTVLARRLVTLATELVSEPDGRRVNASKMLAKNVSELADLAAKDAVGVKRWRQGFTNKHQAAIAKAAANVMKSVQGHSPEADRYHQRQVQKILDASERFFDAVKTGITKGIEYDFHKNVNEVHHDFWDPEMFADGHTKEDYGLKPIDELFSVTDACFAAYSAFWRAFNEKWLANLPTTLNGVISDDATHREILFGFFRAVGKDIEQALSGLASALRALPEQSGEGRGSVGGAITALREEAERAKDGWTVKFLATLLDMTRNRRPMTPKHRVIFEEKLEQYNVPKPNYEKFW